jgi:hypothetical protein
MLAGLVLVATAIYLSYAGPALSQAQGNNPWFFKDSKKADQVWILNSQTHGLQGATPAVVAAAPAAPEGERLAAFPQAARG